jgi:hypothetical protein
MCFARRCEKREILWFNCEYHTDFKVESEPLTVVFVRESFCSSKSNYSKSKYILKSCGVFVTRYARYQSAQKPVAPCHRRWCANPSLRSAVPNSPG